MGMRLGGSLDKPTDYGPPGADSVKAGPKRRLGDTRCTRNVLALQQTSRCERRCIRNDEHVVPCVKQFIQAQATRRTLY